MKSALPKRTRVILLFLFGIVLPCWLLGYLAFRGVQNDLALLEKNRVDEHRRIGEQVSQAIDKSFLNAEQAFQKILSEKNPSNPSDMIQQLEGLKTSHPLIEEVFAIQSDQSIQFFNAFLLYQSGDDIKLPDHSPPDQSVNRLLQQGQQWEFRNQDYKRALDVYRQALRMTSDPHIQGDLLSKIARAQKKSKQFQEAINTYQTIADKYSQIWLMEGIPLGLAARLEIGSFLVDMGEQAKTLDVYMDLYRDLINGDWILEKESYNFYSAPVQDSITRILSQESSSEHLRSRRNTFQELVDEEKKKREGTERLLLFQENASAERELMALQSRENLPERTRRLALEIGTNAYLVCLLWNNPSENEIWGFLVDEQYLSQSLLSGIMQETDLSKGTDWIIRGGDGKTVLA
jgi:tetratricopeptide (TPR) repeat protein